MDVPLFPLSTVLFPGGPLPLRIFETRYVDMISHCMKNDVSFGVLLIREGQETGAATTFEVGTLAKIADWYQGSDGFLGVTAVGEQRFRLVSSRQQADGLNVGEIELIEAEPDLPLPAEYTAFNKILQNVVGELGRLYETLEPRFDDAVWVGYRLAEILPIEAEEKQRLLETSDTLDRLRRIELLIKKGGGPTKSGRS